MDLRKYISEQKKLKLNLSLKRFADYICLTMYVKLIIDMFYMCSNGFYSNVLFICYHLVAQSIDKIKDNLFLFFSKLRWNFFFLHFLKIFYNSSCNLRRHRGT